MTFSRSSSCHRYEEPTKETQFIPEKKYHLESFSRIVPYQSTHMGYYATAVIKEALTTQRIPAQNTEKKYILKRLFKSSVCEKMNVKSVLDEAKILEVINSLFITRLLGKFQTTDELVFVYEWSPTGDLWNVLHEDEELRDVHGFLSLDITRFYAANIILALEHLHERKIAYRNLKPENILVDATGYIKISCMSFAKVRAVSLVLNDIFYRLSEFTFLLTFSSTTTNLQNYLCCQQLCSAITYLLLYADIFLHFLPSLHCLTLYFSFLLYFTSLPSLTSH